MRVLSEQYLEHGNSVPSQECGPFLEMWLDLEAGAWGETHQEDTDSYSQASHVPHFLFFSHSRKILPQRSLTVQNVRLNSTSGKRIDLRRTWV